MSTPKPLIQFAGVHKSFEDNKVLRGVDLHIYEGEVTAIIGKSGCGKSVLLKHIIGLMNQDSGQIFFQGKDTASLSRSEKNRFRRNFSYMFQDNALFDSLTIVDNIALPLTEKGLFSKKERERRVAEMMEKLELGETAELFPAELSGGMRKRVALARALITEPQIILFDEPTTGLDPIRKNTVHQMIDDYRKMFGFTGIIVSHEIPDVFDIAQKIIMLDLGKVHFEGTVDDIFASENDTVRAFLQGHTK